MKTKSKMKPSSILSIVSVGALIAAAVLPITSYSASSEPLDCSALSETIEQKLITNGVAYYELSVIAKDDADHGKKVVGTCAGGTKKILYSKKKESMTSKVVIQESGNASRKTVIKTSNNQSDIHRFVGAKKEFAADPWTRTKEVWGLTFSPEFEYEIRVRPESVQTDAGMQARTTITDIRYKN